MFENFSLFPEAASTVAGKVDGIYFFLVGLSVFFSTLIGAAVIWCVVRYRRRPGHRPQQIEGSLPLELVWSIVPLLICLGVFAWGARVFYEMVMPPKDAMTFFVTGKQWMWKIQHPTGQREINSLHVPVGEQVVLQMISEDVIHDFWVPAFRVKADVLPGMYTTVWFEATKVGTYHLFCAEYCGTKHSEMIGTVTVMDPAEYQEWLAGETAGVPPIEAGKILFENLRCDTCHSQGSGQRGPELAGRFGSSVQLADGQSIRFDEAYVRESLMEPRKRITAGFQPLMPTYQGQISESDVHNLTAYLKSLAAEEETQR